MCVKKCTAMPDYTASNRRTRCSQMRTRIYFTLWYTNIARCIFCTYSVDFQSAFSKNCTRVTSVFFNQFWAVCTVCRSDKKDNDWCQDLSSSWEVLSFWHARMLLKYLENSSLARVGPKIDDVVQHEMQGRKVGKVFL